MGRSRLPLAAAALFAGLAGWLVAGHPAPRAQSSSPLLALLAGAPGQPTSALHLVPLGARELPEAVATIAHLPDAVVRGAPLPDGGFAVVADLVPAREPSWSGALWLVAPNGAARVVADRVCHASRPLVTRQGRLFVERGRPGREPGEEEARAGRLRVDELTVEEIDPTTGRARPVLAWRGYTTHLAGAVAEGIAVYRVGPDGADLVVLDPDGGSVRLLVRLAPFARDFSVDDQGHLVFAGRHGGAWTVERIDPRTGARAILTGGQGGHGAPHAWPGGGVVFNPDGDPGLTALLPGPGRAVRPPAGPGVDVVRALSPDGAWAAALHYAPEGGIPSVLAIPTAGGRAERLPAPAGVRLEIVGFVPEGRR